MDTMNQLASDTLVYMQNGFARVNALQGLLIAIGAAFVLQRWAGVFVVALAATFIHIIVDIMLPVLASSAAFKLPQLVDADYWQYVLTLYVGYLVVITAFYAVKRVLLGYHYQTA